MQTSAKAYTQFSNSTSAADVSGYPTRISFVACPTTIHVYISQYVIIIFFQITLSPYPDV